MTLSLELTEMQAGKLHVASAQRVSRLWEIAEQYLAAGDLKAAESYRQAANEQVLIHRLLTAAIDVAREVR